MRDRVGYGVEWDELLSSWGLSTSADFISGEKSFSMMLLLESLDWWAWNEVRITTEKRSKS